MKSHKIAKLCKKIDVDEIIYAIGGLFGLGLVVYLIINYAIYHGSF